MFSVVAPLSTAIWQHLAHELGIGTGTVFRRELDVGGVALGPRDARRRLRLHLIGRHPQLLLHVDRGRRDEDVDARAFGVPHGFPRAVDVVEAGAREPGDDRTAHRLGDRLDRLEVAVAGDREAGLDDVDTQTRELFGDLELLDDVERDAGRLLAVPQRRVEDEYLIHLALQRWRCFSVGSGGSRTGARKSPPAVGAGGRLRAPGGALAAR